MIKVDIPDYGTLELEHLVLDYNGTLARDGQGLPGVPEALRALEGKIEIHVITADTFGSAAAGLKGLPCGLTVLDSGRQAEAKAAYVRGLGAAKCAAVGNGRNDRLMLKEAALGIVVVQEEGASAETLANARVVCRDIRDALGLLLNPQRLVATLRG